MPVWLHRAWQMAKRATVVAAALLAVAAAWLAVMTSRADERLNERTSTLHRI